MNRIENLSYDYNCYDRESSDFPRLIRSIEDHFAMLILARHDGVEPAKVDRKDLTVIRTELGAPPVLYYAGEAWGVIIHSIEIESGIDRVPYRRILTYYPLDYFMKALSDLKPENVEQTEPPAQRKTTVLPLPPPAAC